MLNPIEKFKVAILPLIGMGITDVNFLISPHSLNKELSLDFFGAGEITLCRVDYIHRTAFGANST